MITWLQYLGTTAAILVFVGIGAKYWGKKWLDNQFAKRLASHEHDLDKVLETHKGQLVVQAEMVRADNQKRIQEFSLFTIRKHEVYAEFYRLLRIAKDKVDVLTVSNNRVPDCKKKTKNEINKYLEHRNVSEVLYNAIQNEEDVEKRQELVNEAIVSRDKIDAREAHRFANEYYALNLIFMTPEIQEIGAKAINQVRVYRDKAINEEFVAMELTNSDNVMEALKNAIQKEIRAGE